MGTRRRHDRPSGTCATGAALLAALFLHGCYAWRPVRLEALRDGSAEIRTRRARFTAPGQSIELVVHRVHRDRVEGENVSSGAESTVDLTRPWRIEVRQPDREAEAVVVFVTPLLAAGALVGIAVLAYGVSSRL